MTLRLLAWVAAVVLALVAGLAIGTAMVLTAGVRFRPPPPAPTSVGTHHDA